MVVSGSVINEVFVREIMFEANFVLIFLRWIGVRRGFFWVGILQDLLTPLIPRSNLHFQSLFDPLWFYWLDLTCCLLKKEVVLKVIRGELLQGTRCQSWHRSDHLQLIILVPCRQDSPYFLPPIQNSKFQMISQNLQYRDQIFY